jgi:hypothetical protein
MPNSSGVESICVEFAGYFVPSTNIPVVARFNSDFAIQLPHSSPGSVFGSSLELSRRQSGIPRPSSASRSSIAAAILCNRLIVEASWGDKRLGIVTASTTAAASTAVSFESRGLSEGWNSVDPLLLPHTLPSAMSTQVAIAICANAFAFSFESGLLGVFHAIEYAKCALLRGDADVVLVLIAEELTQVQRAAHSIVGTESSLAEFAGVFAISREANSCCRIAFVDFGETAEHVIPRHWNSALQFKTSSGTLSDSHAGHSFFAILESLNHVCRSGRVVVSGNTPSLGCGVIGFEQIES